MADDITKKIKIDDLPRATALADTDLFPIVQGVEGNRTTRAVEASLIKAASGASALTELSDVTISSPTDGQVIKYDSSSDKWINADDEGGGTASDITFDNTGTGLTSTNVQNAIVEVKNDIPVVPDHYTAMDITYNNAASGLTSVNAQGAIDELAATLNALKGLGLGYTFVNIQSAEITSQGDLPVET